MNITHHFAYVPWAAICFLAVSISWAESPTDLVEIRTIDPTILIELKYATPDNITKKVLYHSEFRARLRRGVALELKRAQDVFRAQGYTLKVWDAYRPLEVQKELHAVNSDPRFVAEPGRQSMHNRAVAVDVTLVDANGRELLMPTKFDEMSESAFYYYRGKNPEIAKNLALLQTVMKTNGFYACRTEWWHFFSRNWADYPNVDRDEPETRVLRKNESNRRLPP